MSCIYHCKVMNHSNCSGTFFTNGSSTSWGKVKKVPSIFVINIDLSMKSNFFQREEFLESKFSDTRAPTTMLVLIVWIS